MLNVLTYSHVHIKHSLKMNTRKSTYVQYVLYLNAFYYVLYVKCFCLYIYIFLPVPYDGFLISLNM